MSLTGRFNLRRSWTGRIILQVEEEVKALWPRSGPGSLKRRWRDANLMDLAAPEMRALIDLRTKPQFMVQQHYSIPEQPLVPRDDERAEAAANPYPAAARPEPSPRRTAH